MLPLRSLLGVMAIALSGSAVMALPALAEPGLKPGEQNVQDIINDKLAKLATSTDENEAHRLAKDISAAWLDVGAPTIDVLMRRGHDFARNNELNLARDMYDRVILIEPEYAEGWNRRANIFIMTGNLTEAASDLETVLQLEPRHFIAWQLLGQIFESLSENEAALNAYRQALRLHPFAQTAKSGTKRLIPLVEGRSL